MSNRLIGFAILGVGGWFLLSRSGVAASVGLPTLDIDPLTGLPTVQNNPNLTPAQRVALQAAYDHSAAGNAPIVPSQSFAGPVIGLAGAAGSTIAFATIGTATTGAALATAAVTFGIGAAVIFASYELLKQRASMHTNDVRDQWERQFVELHSALGIGPPSMNMNVAPGTLEMAEVIFFFDHDSTQKLWHAVEGTQDETAFRLAAANVDRFLTSNGIPVVNVA